MLFRSPYRALNWYVKRFKLDAPTDPTSGADIGALVANGDWEAVNQHCYSDILKTYKLAERLGYLQRQPVLQEAAF